MRFVPHTAGSLRLNLVSVASPGPKTYKQTSMTLPINPLSACPASPCNAKGVWNSNKCTILAPTKCMNTCAELSLQWIGWC